MNVLFATDGSSQASIALRTAKRLLISVDRNLDLLCVSPKSLQRGTRHAYTRRILGEMTQILEKARSERPLNPGTTKLLTRMGSPSGVIVNRADEYDITVIGATGRGATGEGGLGPVASRVAEHAMAPVLIARDLRAEGNIRVLVAVDGSAASLHAVQTLSSFFDLDSAEICLMHVAETPWIELGLEEDWVTYSEEDKENSEVGVLEKELVREGEAVLEQARDLLRTHRVSITTRVDEGNPADEILSEAERGQYDLIVVGATGARDLKHTMLGSVSSKIAWSAPCSVLIDRLPE